jgi:hypothetical protein
MVKVTGLVEELIMATELVIVCAQEYGFVVECALK